MRANCKPGCDLKVELIGDVYKRQPPTQLRHLELHGDAHRLTKAEAGRARYENAFDRRVCLDEPDNAGESGQVVHLCVGEPLLVGRQVQQFEEVLKRIRMCLKLPLVLGRVRVGVEVGSANVRASCSCLLYTSS